MSYFLMIDYNKRVFNKTAVIKSCCARKMCLIELANNNLGTEWSKEVPILIYRSCGTKVEMQSLAEVRFTVNSSKGYKDKTANKKTKSNMYY